MCCIACQAGNVAAWAVPSLAKLEVLHLHRYKKGEQVFLTYGQHSNLQLLGTPILISTVNASWAVTPTGTAPSIACLLSASCSAHKPSIMCAQVADVDYEPASLALSCPTEWQDMGCTELYGFLLDHNPDDRVMLPMQCFQHNDLKSFAASEDAWLHSSGKPCWNLLRALRLAAASKIERRCQPVFCANMKGRTPSVLIL